MAHLVCPAPAVALRRDVTLQTKHEAIGCLSFRLSLLGRLSPSNTHQHSIQFNSIQLHKLTSASVKYTMQRFTMAMFRGGRGGGRGGSRVGAGAPNRPIKLTLKKCTKRDQPMRLFMIILLGVFFLCGHPMKHVKRAPTFNIIYVFYYEYVSLESWKRSHSLATAIAFTPI